MSNLDFDLPINTHIKDVEFAIQYRLLQQGETHNSQLSKAIKQNVVSMIRRSTESTLDCHDGVIRFFNDNQKALLGVAPSVRPFATAFPDFVKQYGEFETFLKYCGANPAAASWSVSFLPNYFIDHPVPGLKSQVVDIDLNDYETDTPALVFSTPNIIENTMLAGYIKGTIVLRVAAPRYDKKLINKVSALFKAFGLVASSPQKVKLSNDLQHYNIEISPTALDLERQAKSQKAEMDFVSLYEKHANGKKYIFTLEDKPISDRGFKTLDDVQKFLDTIHNSICAIESGKPYHLFMSSMLPLVGITNKGAGVSLDRFRFNFKK